MAEIAFEDMPLEQVIEFWQNEATFWEGRFDGMEANAKKWMSMYEKAVRERNEAHDEVAKLKARLFDLMNA